MRTLRLVGLSADGSRLVLGDGDARWDLVVDDALVDQVKAARAVSAAVPDAPAPTRAPTPREVQERIRRGESAADLARTSGVPLEHVTRYEGPVLAERAHHARLARLSSVGGRPVEELLEEHMQRMAQVGLPLVWDSWLTDSGRWDVLVRCGRVLVRLSWDPTARRVSAVDEAGRRALGLMPAEQDTLSAVLRPVASRALQAAAQPWEALDTAQGAGPSDAGAATPSPAPSSPPLSPAATVQAPAAQLVLDEMGDAGAAPAPGAGSAQTGRPAAASGPAAAASGPAAAETEPARGAAARVPVGSELSGSAGATPAAAVQGTGRPGDAAPALPGTPGPAPAAAVQETGRPGDAAPAATGLPGTPGPAAPAPSGSGRAGAPAAPADASSTTGLPGGAAAVAAGPVGGSVRVSPADRVAARTAAVEAQGPDDRVGAGVVGVTAAGAVRPAHGLPEGAGGTGAAAGAPAAGPPTTAAQEVTPPTGVAADGDASDTGAPGAPGDPATGAAAAEPEVPPRPAPPRPPVGPPRPGSRQGGRPKRAQVPTWDDISGASTGRTGPPRRGAS